MFSVPATASSGVLQQQLNQKKSHIPSLCYFYTSYAQVHACQPFLECTGLMQSSICAVQQPATHAPLHAIHT